MKIDNWIKAALLGLSLAYTPVITPGVSAETLRVVKKGTASTLAVPMNRAVVVESDEPFSELSIANPGIADISSLSDRTIYVLGKSPGLTTLTLFDATGRLITNVTVHVAPDTAEFKERLRQILPGEQIEVRTANDGIVLSGNVSSAQHLQRALDLAERYAPERVSNLMAVSGVQQVMLKVRFAEMQRTVSKSLSASLGFNGGNNVGVNGGIGTLNNQPALTNSLAGNIPVSNDNVGAILFGFNAGSMQVNLLLEALEQKGVVRTLAEPNLSALSGQEATFLAGGEYPIPVAQKDGLFSIEYKPFGIELGFIPRVVDSEVINLELNAAVSAIDPSNSVTINGFSVDAFQRRETSTTVEMRDGESFAIARQSHSYRYRILHEDRLTRQSEATVRLDGRKSRSEIFERLEPIEGGTLYHLVEKHDHFNLLTAIGFWINDFGADHALAYLDAAEGHPSLAIFNQRQRSPLSVLSRLFKTTGTP